MATRRKSRRHPGVTLIKPNKERRTGWRARFVDADTGRTKWQTLPPHVRNKEQREDWAARLSDKLGKRRDELEHGAPRATGTPFEDAIEEYFKRTAAEVDKRTHEAHRTATNRFVDFAKRRRIRTTDDLAAARLADFRDEVVAAPRTKVARNREQGQRIETSKRRAPATINKELRSVGRVLRVLIKRGYFARLRLDDLHVLEPVKGRTERREFLRPKELQKLFEAAQRHDEATFALTRDEKAAGKTESETARYEPISEFLAFVTLTGMRLSEALAIEWRDVDLDALDHTGETVGEIYVGGRKAKTGQHRTVGLRETPALRSLLAAMKLRSGGKGRVFADVTRDGAIKAMRRLRSTYGASAGFSWQVLRVTASTYLTNAPSIYGGASAFLSAKRCGHSVKIAEQSYSGLVSGIPADLHTLEEVLQVQEHVAEVTTRVQTRRAA